MSIDNKQRMYLSPFHTPPWFARSILLFQHVGVILKNLNECWYILHLVVGASCRGSYCRACALWKTPRWQLCIAHVVSILHFCWHVFLSIAGIVQPQNKKEPLMIVSTSVNCCTALQELQHHIDDELQKRTAWIPKRLQERPKCTRLPPSSVRVASVHT